MLFFFQAEDGIRDLVRSRGLGDVYKRQEQMNAQTEALDVQALLDRIERQTKKLPKSYGESLSLIHI